MKRPGRELPEGNRNDPTAAIVCPLIGNHGASDTGAPVDDIEKLEEALKQNGKRYDIKIYISRDEPCLSPRFSPHPVRCVV